MIFVLSLSALVVAGANSIIRDPAGDAAAACATLNLTMQLSLMRGFGQIDGYSRNSGCGDLCGRHTFRWDNVSLKTSYMLLPMPFIFTSFFSHSSYSYHHPFLLFLGTSRIWRWNKTWYNNSVSFFFIRCCNV